VDLLEPSVPSLFLLGSVVRGFTPLSLNLGHLLIGGRAVHGGKLPIMMRKYGARLLDIGREGQGCGELNVNPAPHLETRNSMSCSVNSPALGLTGSIEDGGDRGWAVSKAPPGQVSGRVPLLGKDSIKDFLFVCLQVCTQIGRPVFCAAVCQHWKGQYFITSQT